MISVHPMHFTDCSSHHTPKPAVNLATNRNLCQSNCDSLAHLNTRFQDESTVVTAGLAPSGLEAPQFFGTSTVESPASIPSFSDSCGSSTHGSASPPSTVSSPDSQINLATSSFDVYSSMFPRDIYDRPSEFGPPYNDPFRQSPVSVTTHCEEAEITATGTPGYNYSYACYDSSAPPIATGYEMSAHESGSGLDHFQHDLGVSLLSDQAFTEIFDENQLGPIHVEMQQDSCCSGPQSSEGSLRPSLHSVDSFDTMFNNLPLGSEAWSSAGFSSPSLASFNSSPSTRNDFSTYGTPSLGPEDHQVHYSEPLLSGATPYYLSIPQQMSPTPGAESPIEIPRRERRGAISQQGNVFSMANSTHPMLEDSIARHLYADDFQIEGVDNGPAPGDSRVSNGFTTPPPFQEADSPSGSSTLTGASLMSTCDDVKTDSAARPSSMDAPTLSGRASSSKSGGSPQYHPYARTVKVSKHEQVIQFDESPLNAESSRKSAKRSKGSKRCYCTYVYPVKGKQCTASVGREADLSRHQNKHRLEEQDLIDNGLLAPEDATDFSDLKSTGAATCKGCNNPMSRKDALVRHLKNAGKACRVFYPDVNIK